MRTIIAGCVVAVLSFGVAVADDFFFTVSKIENKDGKYVVTGKKKKKNKDDDAPKEQTFTIDSSVKVFKGEGVKGSPPKVGDEIETGFKDEAFKDVSADKTVNLYLTTEGDKVTKVVFVKGKKKKTE